MKYNIIIGSGLVALICRKILGSNWKIIPFAQSRFYGKGIPALGDDFVHYNQDVLEIIKNWGMNTSPLFYKRPYSVSGSLLYNSMFADKYIDRIGLSPNPLNIDYYKTDFTVFSFSCIQLYRQLLNEYVTEIKNFADEYPNSKTISSIRNGNVLLDSGKVIEYDNAISTIPYYALCEMIGMPFNGNFLDTYLYYVQDSNINIEGANQVLICDDSVPFHKCTKISNSKYTFEIINTYYDNIQQELSKVIGSNFEILSGAMIQNGHVLPHKIDDNTLNDNNIICMGSYAQCDPLIDISSVIKRTHNLLNKNKIQQ